MAKIGSNLCKKIYVTDDNPRNENPGKIRKEIIKNIKNKNCLNIGNRAKAIRTAILNAEPNETILISGKGHEDQQIYKNKILKISDKKIIKKSKLKIKKNSRRSNFQPKYQNFKRNFKKNKNRKISWNINRFKTSKKK